MLEQWKSAFPLQLGNQARQIIKSDEVSFSEAMLITHAVALLVMVQSIAPSNAADAQQPTIAETFAIRLSKESPSTYANYIHPLFDETVHNRLTLAPRVVTPSKTSNVDETVDALDYLY